MGQHAAKSGTDGDDLAGGTAQTVCARLRQDVVRIADPHAREIYGRDTVLVRPDGLVAWRSNAPAAEPVALLRRVTA